MASREEIDETSDDRVQVFLKFRPVQGENNKVEDGVLEVLNDKSVSIFSADEDEPTTFELDGVFDEAASNSQVHESVCGNLAARFVSGKDCTVVAYGPLQTGKTYNLFGNICDTRKNGKKGTKAEIRRSTQSATKPKQQDKNNNDDNDSNSEESDESMAFKKSKKGDTNSGDMDFDDFGALDDLIQGALEGIPAEDETDSSDGIAVAVCRQIFDALEKDSPEILNLTMKVSVVEIYLDRINDLLIPQSERDDFCLKENPRGGATVIQGCAALSCVQPSDMLDVVRRGLQQRTLSQLQPYCDSHRSTVVVQIRLEQERRRQINRSSVLQIVDLCASEFPSNGSSPVAQQLDQSIAAGILSLQKEVTEPTPFSAPKERPTLSRLLLPFCRGETVSRVLLTASKLDVGACQRSLDFGIACRQLPAIRLPDPETILPDSTPSDVVVERERRLTELVFALAHECNRVAKSAKTTRHGPVWTAISEIQKLPHQHRPLRFYVETKREHEINAEKFAIRAELREAERKANTHKHLMKQLDSDVKVLRAQNEQLQQDLKHRSDQLDKNKHHTLQLEKRIKEVEYNLRTSQFRESEAVVFLRQFRKFYYRLMRQIHGEDSSPGGSIVKQIAGTPDLIQLIDLDKSMVESGLMEEEEIGEIMPLSKTYLPSQQALVRSIDASEAAVKAVDSEKAACIGSSHSSGGVDDALILSDETTTPSIVKRHETGEATEARQRLYKTPAGRYLSMREGVLEKELLALSEKYAKLQDEFKQEKATRKVLESTSPAVNKAKHAKELRTLKEQLSKKSNDLKAVIFKMNEIHTVSQTLQEKVADREQHVEFLEEELSSMQAKESALLKTREETERRLKREIEEMQVKLESIPAPIWQLSELGTRLPPISSRISLSFGVRANDLEKDGSQSGRMSMGEDEDWLDKLYESGPGGILPSGENGGIDEIEALQSEVKQLKDQLQEARSRPVPSPGTSSLLANRATGVFRPAVQAVHADANNKHEPSVNDDEDENLSVPESDQSGQNSVSGLLFMEDDVAVPSPRVKNKRRSSVYGNIVNAYNMQSDHSPEKVPGGSSSTLDAPPSVAIQLKARPLSGPSLVTSPQKASEPLVHKKAPSFTNRVGRWQPSKPKPTSVDDDNSGVPEWMRKFKTIAARNHAESVIETSGSAEARELTRTSFGETLKHTHGAEHREDGEMSPLKKWTPKKKKEDDSDSDDSFAKSFLAGASSHIVEPIEISDAGEVESQEGSGSSEVEDQDDRESDHDSQPSTRQQRTESESKDNSGDEEREKKMMHYSAPSPEVGQDEDPTSGSDDDSDEEGDRKQEPSKPVPASVPATKKPLLDDSSSEGDSGEERKAQSKPLPRSMPKLEPAAVALSCVPKKKTSFLDDSDSEVGSDQESIQPTPREEHLKPAFDHAPEKKKSFSDDSDSEVDSDGESKADSKSEPLQPPKPSKKKSFLDDSDSESGSDESAAKPVTTPTLESPRPAPAPTPVLPKKKSFLDDSDSDNDSDDVSAALPLAATKPKSPKPSPSPAKKKSSFLDDSDSDEDSDEESKAETSEPMPGSDPQKKSYLDDSGVDPEEEDDVKEIPNHATRSNSSTPNHSDSSDDDSDDRKATTAQTKPAHAAGLPYQTDSRYDSESEESYHHKEQGSDDTDSEEEETERAGSGHQRRNTGDPGDLDCRTSPIGDHPIAPGGRSSLIDSQHDSEDEESVHSSYIGGKPADTAAIRGVPDFGAGVISGIPQTQTEQNKFAIKNGKLVKDSGHKTPSKRKKPKFSIVGGKLVQDDNSTRSAPRRTKSNDIPGTPEGGGGKVGAAATRRASVTAMVPAARSPQKGGKPSNFAIKGGKLVKSEEKPKQPASFSIMGGKLVKAGDTKKGKKGTKKARKDV